MKTVLITGANRGLGLKFVRQHHELGWKVIACCRNPEKAKELKSINDNNLEVYELDVNNSSHLQSLLNSIQDEPIDLLINNAGVYELPSMDSR